MARTLCLALWIGAVISLDACYRTYTGIYWIPNDRVIDLQQLDHEVFEAVRDLGFERARPGAMMKAPEKLPDRGLRFEGDQAAVSVAVTGNPLSITVRDLSNLHETEFSRQLKHRIEQRLEEKYHLKNVNFQRQPEFVPN